MMSNALSCVATLVARKGHAGIDGALLAACRRVLGTDGPCVWLDDGLAADIAFTAAPDRLADLRLALRDAIGGQAIDMALQRSDGRRKRLFLADMDSTMIAQECIDELADFAGLKPQVSAITERAMRGEIAFEPALRERVALLRGLPTSAVDEVLRTRVTMTPGAGTLVRTMRGAGVYCALVSGGFTAFTGPVAERLGFDEHRSNVLDIADGRLAGTVAEPILGREAKLDRLLALRARLGLEPHETLAVGDGANDLAMLGEAGLGVAFRAKPAVAAAAHARVDHTDLTALLFFQGFARRDVVE